MTGHVILDLSRLLWRAERFAPTGIDRVELAYARHLIAVMPDDLSFSGWWGRMSLLPKADAMAMIAALDLVWSGADIDVAAFSKVRTLTKRLRRHALLRGEAGLHAHVRGLPEPAIYLLVSHYRLHRPAALLRLERHAAMRFIFLIHDLIPIHLPEHVPPGHDVRHRKRMETVMRLADHVIANSQGTRAALDKILVSAGVKVPVTVAPLGLDMKNTPRQQPPADARPYFVCLSTIEPRKNHKMLIRIWRRLAQAMGDATPHLIVLGRHGWRSAEVLKEIQRDPVLRPLVHVYENLPDSAVADTLRGARALLHPSFAEGFGLPVAEALCLGVPVVCSALDELREVGQGAPDYVDPRDEAGWLAMVSAYAQEPSVRRQAQLARLSGWGPMRWEEHFAITVPLLRECTRGFSGASY